MGSVSASSARPLKTVTTTSVKRYNAGGGASNGSAAATTNRYNPVTQATQPMVPAASPAATHAVRTRPVINAAYSNGTPFEGEITVDIQEEGTPSPVPTPAPVVPQTINITVVPPPPPPVNVDVNVNVEAPEITVNNQAQANAQAGVQVVNETQQVEAALVAATKAGSLNQGYVQISGRQSNASAWYQPTDHSKWYQPTDHSKWYQPTDHSKYPVTPLILDLDGNGLAFSNITKGTRFDIDGDGLKEQVAWSTADAWLALDRNGNGTIDSGKELFGNQHGAANGFEELKKHDDNHDGIINSQDAVFTQLRTWIDANGDGVSQAEELKTLQEAGVKQLFLAYDESSATDTHGNEFRQISQLGFQRSGWLAQRVSKTQGISLAQALFGALIDVWVQALKTGNQAA
ncbi:MAG: hypothetical protein KC474_07160 [Cyanobacteria bacterium HKST-UBA04]|nr:hypothetical protein [Cyanobacteria bacterium HKST-UBA04]